MDTIPVTITSSYSISANALPGGPLSAISSYTVKVISETTPRHNSSSSSTSTSPAADSSSSTSSISTTSPPSPTASSTTSSSDSSSSVSNMSSTPVSIASSTTTPVPVTSLATNSTANSTTRGSKHSISPGAAAGIGVGSAVAGALIAALILCFIIPKAWKRRKVPTKRSSEERGYEMVPNNPNSVVTMHPSLPQPLGDQKIRDEFSTISTVIKNHVQSYYHTAPPSMKTENVNQAVLEVLGRDAPVIASALTALLSDPDTRMAALRFCIAWIVTSRIEPNCEPDVTFLPPEIVGCLHAMSAQKNEQQSKFTLLSTWRVVSADLLQKTYGGQRTLSHADSRYPNIENAFQTLDRVLYPYAKQSLNSDRLKNLEEILKRGARVGFLLFSQLSIWKFDWKEPGRARAGTRTVFPALIKVEDGNEQTTGTQRVLVEGEVA